MKQCKEVKFSPKNKTDFGMVYYISSLKESKKCNAV